MKIKINGTIVSNDDKWKYVEWGIDSFSPGDLLIFDGEDVNIEIDSPGGYIFPASEIYTALLNHKGNVNILITGRAASAASVIAMAGTHVSISPTAQIMIHNVSASGSGDYRDFEHYAEQLKKSNNTMANAYVIKTGKSKKEILELMNHETWFTPHEALKYGLVDNIVNDSRLEQERLNLLALKVKS